MRVGLFGATGFVGGYLIDALVEAGHEPSVLVRSGSERKLRLSDRCRVISGDLGNVVAIDDVLEGCDAAIFTVGLLRECPRRGITCEETHHLAAARVVDAAKRAGVGQFLLMSANGVQRPGTPYQETKLDAEDYLRASGLNFTIFRPSVIFGNPQGKMEIATQLFQEMVRPPVPAIGFHTGLSPANGPIMMSPVHVRDVADAFLRSLDNEAMLGKCLEIGGPENLSWTEMLRRISQAVDKRKLIVPMPLTVMKFAATLFDWLPFFPATRDQLTMLAQGNTAGSEELEALIERPAKSFTAENLGYLD